MCRHVGGSRPPVPVEQLRSDSRAASIEAGTVGSESIGGLFPREAVTSTADAPRCAPPREADALDHSCERPLVNRQNDESRGTPLGAICVGCSRERPGRALRGRGTEFGPGLHAVQAGAPRKEFFELFQSPSTCAYVVDHNGVLLAAPSVNAARAHGRVDGLGPTVHPACATLPLPGC